MFSNVVGRKINDYVSDYVLFDLETTGTSPSKDKVVEISGVKVINSKIDSEFSMLVNPEMHIPFYATQVNNITDEMVADAPTFDVALKEFMDFAGDYVLVGHNIQLFDLKYLYRDAKLYFGKTIDNDYVDTLPLSRKYLPQLAHHTLLDLARHYNIEIKDAHRALGDCRMNQEVFECLHQDMIKAAEMQIEIPICPNCGSPLKERNGKFGIFMGCSSYPLCRYTRNV